MTRGRSVAKYPLLHGPSQFAAEDDQGPEVRFCGYVPTHHRQTNNGVELWAAAEALQGFWVPKLAILTDSQYLQLGATGRASVCASTDSKN